MGGKPPPPLSQASSHQQRGAQDGDPGLKGVAAWGGAEEVSLGPARFPGEALEEGPLGVATGQGPEGRQSRIAVGVTSIWPPWASRTCAPANHSSVEAWQPGGRCLALFKVTGRGASPQEASPREQRVDFFSWLFLGITGSGEILQCHTQGTSRRRTDVSVQFSPDGQPLLRVQGRELHAAFLKHETAGLHERRKQGLQAEGPV